MQQARKLVTAEWLSSTLCCDLTFQLIKMLSEQVLVAARGRRSSVPGFDAGRRVSARLAASCIAAN